MKQQPTAAHDTGKPAITVAQPARRSGGIRRYALIMAALLVASLSFNVLAVSRLPGITPIDGAAYIDAFARAMDGSVARRGDTFDGPTLDAIACRGIHGLDVAGQSIGAEPMRCGPDGRAVVDEVHTQWDAIPSTGYVHPPTYFFATAWSVIVLQAVVPGEQDSIDLARLLGALWFSLGALLLVRAAALWGARPWAAALVLLAFLPTPTFVSLFTFVTPDAMGLAVAAAAMLGVTLWWKRRMPAWPLLVFGLATTAVKQTYVLAAVAGAFVLFALWFCKRRRPFAETAKAAGWLLGGAAAGGIAWTVVRQILASGPLPPTPGAGNFMVLEPTVDALLGLLVTPGALIPAEAAGPLLPMPPGIAAVAAALGLLTAAAAFGALLHQPVRTARFALAAGGVVAIILGGLLLASLTLVSDGVLLPAAPRYAFGAWAFYVLPLLLVAGRRWITVAILVCIAIGAASWLM